MKWAVVTIVTVLCMTGLAGFYIYQSHNRFSIVVARPETPTAYMIDRKTGEAWLVWQNRKHALKDAGAVPK
jgi:hypothetical protein